MPTPGRLRALALCVLGASASTLAGAAESPGELLAATDLFARAPAAARLRLDVGQEGSDRTSALEIYRDGADRALVRLLDERDRGKFVLRRGDETWFLAPGARPVRLGASYRLQGGAALDEILGLSLATDYAIESSGESNGVVTFDLVANAPGAPYPRIRWAVDAAKRLPLRAELRSRDGRPLRVIELRAWLDAAKLVPGELAIADLVRGGPKRVVRFLEIEPRDLPAALFDLDDAGARARLAETP